MSNRKAAGWAIGLVAILFVASTATAQDVRTIAPGMTADEVKAEYGQPDGVSARGPFTYYFYNNGCEYECGFPDLIILENGQVVDAVLRAPWNEYAGESSSPKGTVARPTPGGMRLDVPTTTIEAVEVRQVETPPAETPPPEMPPVETPPAEAPPIPPPAVPAEEVVEEISPEFFAFVPVCGSDALPVHCDGGQFSRSGGVNDSRVHRDGPPGPDLPDRRRENQTGEHRLLRAANRRWRA
jgi:hypothetical protein